MKVMNFKSWVNNFNESSLKDEELNRILDKMSDSKPLSDIEKRFLSKLNSYSEDQLKDYMYLSKNDVFNKVSGLLRNKDTVICDLYDKNGKIGIEIKSIHNNFDEDFCFIILKSEEKVTLRDNFSYNVIYDIKKDEYSLQIQDEFYEKIPVKK
jgi:hypothetical protein